jgi:pyruvate/2-oxoacid:ferredoxin oxidoreductase alpha subunit
MPREVISGNIAQAYAATLARVQVVAAYPITPQTTIVEKLAELVAAGELPAQFLKVESEHSALQACVSASALGARTYTATSSQGLLLMHELLHWASGMRTPVVMGVANRGVAVPWTIDVDHTDTIAQRDTGWLQYYCTSNQEVLDTVLTAFRIAEDPEVRLPAMVAEDAFFLTHTVEPVDIPSAAEVDRFLPPRSKLGSLPLDGRGRLGSFTGPEHYTEFRRAIADGMDRAAARTPEIEAEYERIIGRSLGGPLPTYRVDDADAVLVTMGTVGSTARAVVDELRAGGHKVGLARLRRFRPFPVDEVRDLASRVGRIGVVDRSFTFGPMGAAATEVAGALYGAPDHPMVRDFVTGLGGRDITPARIEAMYETLLGPAVDEVTWPGRRGLAEVPGHG